MIDEQLAKALASDPEVIPRYNLISADGTILHENVQLNLANEVLVEATKLNKANLLSDLVAEKFPNNPTVPNDIFDYLGDIDRLVAEKGSYVGTGTHGVDNPTLLTFNFVPMLVIIGLNSDGLKVEGGYNCWDESLLWINPQTRCEIAGNGQATYATTSVFANTFSVWSSTYASRQVNALNSEYIYFAIGIGGI